MIREALNVGPEDQSLWVYHSFLMGNLTEDLRVSGSATAAANVFAPNLTLEERVTYLARDIEETRELLEDYDDVKLVYKSLVLYTRDLCRLEGDRVLGEQERRDLTEWLEKLKVLDPMREGLWIDMEKELGLTKLGSRTVS